MESFNLFIYGKRKHDMVSLVTCSYSHLPVIIWGFHPDMSQCKAHAPNQWPSHHLIFPGDPCIAQGDSRVFTSDIILEKWVKVFSLKNVFNVAMFWIRNQNAYSHSISWNKEKHTIDNCIKQYDILNNYTESKPSIEKL